MRAVVQRVSRAEVRVDGSPAAAIGNGLAVLVGVAPGDAEADASALATKLVELRIFGDDAGKMNRSVAEVGGEILVVSQFTLLANARKGRRPSFVGAAPPDVAEPIVVRLTEAITESGVPCQTGRFGARMEVELVNDGPVTLILDVTEGRVA